MGRLWPFPTDGLPCSPPPIQTCRAALLGGVGGAPEKFATTFAIPLACFTLRYKSAFALSKYQLDPVADSKVFKETAGEITAPFTRICPGPELVRINTRTSDPVAFSNVSDRV